MNNSTSDAGIPVLTEVIPPPEDVNTAPAATVQEDTVSEALAPSEWDEEKWQRLEIEIRERILYQILERIDFVLEQRVRDSLAGVLQTSVEKLADELKNGLHHTIKELVTRTVSQEIAKLQSSKK